MRPSKGGKPFATLLKGFAYLTVPTMAAYRHNKDNPEYNSLPEWEKMLFIHPFQFENGRWMRIPKPPGVLNLVFSYLPQKFIEFMGEKDPQAVTQALEGFISETPLRYTPLSGWAEVELLTSPSTSCPMPYSPWSRSRQTASRSSIGPSFLALSRGSVPSSRRQSSRHLPPEALPMLSGEVPSR